MGLHDWLRERAVDAFMNGASVNVFVEEGWRYVARLIAISDEFASFHVAFEGPAHLIRNADPFIADVYFEGGPINFRTIEEFRGG